MPSTFEAVGKIYGVVSVKILFRCALLFTVVCFSSVGATERAVENLRETGKAFSSVAKKVSPSVVFIKVESSRGDSSSFRGASPFGEEWPFGDDLFKRFFGQPFANPPESEGGEMKQQPIIGQGSGFIFSIDKSLFSNKAYILTNYHVVKDADKITIRLDDEREFTAEVVGSDQKSDVAVLKIDVGDLPIVSFGDSSKLEVGEWVIAIGNPFGLSHTLTVGVVSAKGRNSVGISDYEDFIQTDAAINPGNSGGPLANLDGDVVGMNTAIFSRTGGYMGIGFAIPIDLVRSVADQLIKHGAVTRGYLGVVIQELTPELASSFDLKEKNGILVSQVSGDTPAEKAGLKVGDIITRFQGKPVSSIGDFRNRVALTPPATNAKLVVQRDGKEITLTVKIGKLDDKKQPVTSQTKSENIGLSVETLTPKLAQEFDLKAKKGVVVTNVFPGSVASIAGIRRGSVILQVDRKPVRTVEEFTRLVDKSSVDKNVLLLIQFGDASSYVVLSWS